MSLLKNDKSTYKDEIFIGIFTAIMAIVAALIFIFKNSIPEIIRVTAITFAALLVVTVIMMLIILIYRCMDNHKSNKTNNEEE